MTNNPAVHKKEKLGARMTTGDKVFMVVVYALLSILMIVMLYPMVFVISASFSDPNLVGHRPDAALARGGQDGRL